MQTFRFLKALTELRNPVPRDLSQHDVLRLDEWPSHACVFVRRGDATDEDDGADTGSGIEPVIRIQRARLTQCPRPPDAIAEWVKPGWDQVNGASAVLETRNLEREKGHAVSISFRDSPERVLAFEAWVADRSRWAEAERPSVAARELFERVHELWTKMQRESDSLELVLADGMLGVAELAICYPVLTRRVSLEFDPRGPAFLFSTGTESADLNRALLRLVPRLEARMMAHFEKELETEPISPLGGEVTTSFFRRLVEGLFTNGEFCVDKAEAASLAQPTLWREPTLVVRARTAGLSTTLDHVIEDLQREDAPAPEGLSRIMGIESPLVSLQAGSDETELDPSSGAGQLDILFSKPTNEEQYQIAARLALSRAVLVQGPPGTGKTHTIANLLGCLLAQGKTVLVTAHTTKALRVLREKVDPALQPLCLSVLDAGSESHAQLSHAAQAIAARLSTSDAPSLRREAAVLRERRLQLAEQAESLRHALRGARLSEIEEIVCSGVTLRPIEAAKRVKERAVDDSWVPAPVQPGTPCPLTDAELRELYASQRSLTPADEVQLQVPQPALAKLVLPSDFRLRATEEADAGVRASLHRPELWAESRASGFDSAQLQQLLELIQQATATLMGDERWLREVLFSGWSGGDLKSTWEDLLAVIDALSVEAAATLRVAAQYGPELPPDRPADEMAATLTEIVGFLEGGDSLGFLTRFTRRPWHRLDEACRVDGHRARTLDEFRALRAVAQLKVSRAHLVSRWRRTVQDMGGPDAENLGELPERAAQAHAVEIRRRLEWRQQVWEPLLDSLRAAGFLWEAWLDDHPAIPHDHGELARIQRACSDGLAAVVQARAAILRRAELAAALEEQRVHLQQFPQSHAARILLEAQADWNAASYGEAHREIARLEALQDGYRRRVALLAQLRPAAPAWAHAIAQRTRPHYVNQPPGDSAAAWLWRQLHQELERRAAVSMEEIQSQLSRIEAELMQLAAQIVEQETWAAQCDRTGLQARQALVGFVQTLRKLGKGTGKRAPELLRQARQLLTAARSAVPVWIMPLSRVYENFDPRERKFDVVIIDEASQSDVTALAALYLGNEHIVVGDKEQVTPDAVGQRLEDVERLIAADLRGVPNSHLYDGQTSIYDLAETAFGGVVALREHFRCVPEIIQFCNHLSYGNAIRPLREPLSAGVGPALVPHRVRGFRASGTKTNEVEALEIASLIVACLRDEDYELNDRKQPTSFGVISLVGDEQTLQIEKLLRQHLAPDLFVKHRLLCGNAAQFQGDERDVIFLSMVDQPPDAGQLSRRDAGPKDIFKKRYNVAVSRARNQLWVVHSLDPAVHLKAGDLRRRLIEHARDPSALLRTVEEQGQRVDSVLERLVLERLMSAGYRVQTQVAVGSLRIDLVVGEEAGRRLAIECDGEQWHTHDQLQKDLERQAVLERQGWIFTRIRGSVFFRDPESAMVPVFARLRELGIEPQGGVAQDEMAVVGSELVERVRRSAEAIREEWGGTERRSA